MSVISIVRPDTVTVDQATVERARAWYNENHQDAPLRRRTPNQVILDYIDAGRPDVVVPVKAPVSTALVADKTERRAFRAWAKEAGYEVVDRSAVDAWEAAGKPVPEAIVNADVSGKITYKPLDKMGRPNGKTVERVITSDEMSAKRGGKRGRAAWSDYLDFAPEGVQVLTIATAKTSITLEDGKLPTGEMSLKARLAEAEARIAELEEENAILRGE